jgi:hypothetical protein
LPGHRCCSTPLGPAASTPESSSRKHRYTFFRKNCTSTGISSQPLAQGRNADLNEGQPVEQILSKTTRQDLGAQIAVGCRDQAHADG